MSDFRITHQWSSYQDAEKEVGETTAQLSIHVGGQCLTNNYDLFSKTVRDDIHVSLYPLALWFASSWWRLHHEILPDIAPTSPSHGWRMNHEMTAANMGFLWPHIMFAADGDQMQIWAQDTRSRQENAVKFLNGLSFPRSIAKSEFDHQISSLIETVIARLHEVGCGSNDLAALWQLIQQDQKNPKELSKRRLEALLGFDPEDCAPELIEQASALEVRIGPQSFAELTGAYAMDGENRLASIQALIAAEGVEGRPDDTLKLDISEMECEPWKVGVAAARALRARLGNISDRLDDSTLKGLLGLPSEVFRDSPPASRPKAAIAEPREDGTMRFLPRRPHPIAHRFELARYIGDYIRSQQPAQEKWLISADLSTTQQKRQRAFAAELLCPIDSLTRYLRGDFTEAAREDAAQHYAVSERTVEALLMNNGHLPRPSEGSGLPYRVETRAA